MIQNKTNESNIKNWLPKKKLRESIQAETFWSTVIVAVFTFIFIFEKNSSPLMEFGSILASITLGFFINNCWKEWKNGSINRREAIKISNDIDLEFSIITQYLQREFLSIDHLSSYLSQEDVMQLHKSASYFVRQRLVSVQEKIGTMSAKIRILGYDDEAFVETQAKHFVDMKNLISRLISDISASAGSANIDMSNIDAIWKQSSIDAVWKQEEEVQLIDKNGEGSTTPHKKLPD